MAEAKKMAPAKREPVLRPAGESSDPTVHQLLAERQTAVINGDADAAATVDGKLAKLGYK